jgi:HNH endonuclease
MSITSEVRLQVRQRANFACEYCGVTETDTGGELTIDHHQPQVHGGSDDLSNLLYCCQRCNLYKLAYWPTTAADPVLWNPRREPRDTHVLLLADGTVYPLTQTGAFTIRRLRLNRPPLIAYRLRQQARAEEARLLTQFRDVVALLERLQQQHAALLDEQRALLEEQQAILTLLLKRNA